MEKNYYLIGIAPLIVVLILGIGLWQQNKTDTNSLTATSTIINNINNQISASTSNQIPNNKMKNIITLETSLGQIQFETYNNDAPNTVANFIKLAKDGYYNGLVFHRVIKDFMIQGGDPNCTQGRGTGLCGTGGPGYQFADELNPETESYKAGYQKGVVAMANAGPNTNGSQFFIMHQAVPLPNAYSIFGKVIKGQEIVDKIANVETDAGDRPVEDIIIKSVAIN